MSTAAEKKVIFTGRNINMSIITDFYVDRLRVRVMDSRAEMGRVAGTEIAERLRALLSEQDAVNVIFAAAPSQNEVLQALNAADGIDWARVNAFHMDEYIGLDRDAPQGFGNFLRERIFSKKPFRSVHYIDSAAGDAAAECVRYAALLSAFPPDVVVLGIGENGHIAFNDPWVADFQDPALVKAVPLDEVCRMQQVNDGCFASLDAVPKTALTLTVPALFAGRYLFCSVPAATKANAVRRTLRGAISPECPATVLRRHPSANLYCDPDSAGGIL